MASTAKKMFVNVETRSVEDYARDAILRSGLDLRDSITASAEKSGITVVVGYREDDADQPSNPLYISPKLSQRRTNYEIASRLAATLAADCCGEDNIDFGAVSERIKSLILMPDPAFEERYKAYGSDHESLANYFGVSVADIKARIHAAHKQMA